MIKKDISMADTGRCMVVTPGRMLYKLVQAMTQFREFLTVSEAARVLGVDPMTLRRWDRAKKLVAQRHPYNNYRLYTRSAIDLVLKQLTQTAHTRRGVPAE